MNSKRKNPSLEEGFLALRKAVVSTAPVITLSVYQKGFNNQFISSFRMAKQEE